MQEVLIKWQISAGVPNKVPNMCMSNKVTSNVTHFKFDPCFSVKLWWQNMAIHSYRNFFSDFCDFFFFFITMVTQISTKSQSTPIPVRPHIFIYKLCFFFTQLHTKLWYKEIKIYALLCFEHEKCMKIIKEKKSNMKWQQLSKKDLTDHKLVTWSADMINVIAQS